MLQCQQRCALAVRRSASSVSGTQRAGAAAICRKPSSSSTVRGGKVHPPACAGQRSSPRTRQVQRSHSGASQVRALRSARGASHSSVAVFPQGQRRLVPRPREQTIAAPPPGRVMDSQATGYPSASAVSQVSTSSTRGRAASFRSFEPSQEVIHLSFTTTPAFSRRSARAW